MSEEVSDIDENEFEQFRKQKQAERANRGMLKGTLGESFSDSDDSDYWKEKPGNLPRDMRKGDGIAQILLPGFELQDIGLPKDEKKKEEMIKMYNDAMKTALQGMYFRFYFRFYYYKMRFIL